MYIGTLVAVIGMNGIWAVIIALPSIQRDSEVDLSMASLPLSMTMVGFGIGNILAGKMVDRFGFAIPIGFSGVLMSLGYFLVSVSQNIFILSLSQGVFIGLGASVSLYLVSANFGLSQGGIIPSYTLIIREYLPAKEAV